MVFVLRYPLLDYLPAMPDIMESRPHRKMWDPTSPITFFAVHPNNRNNLIPIAIQMDVKPGMNKKRSSVRKKNKTLKKNVDYCKKTSSICVHSMKVTEKYLGPL